MLGIYNLSLEKDDTISLKDIDLHTFFVGKCEERECEPDAAWTGEGRGSDGRRFALFSSQHEISDEEPSKV